MKMLNPPSALVVNWQLMIVQMINAAPAVLVVQDMVAMYHHVTTVSAILTSRAPMMIVSITAAIVIITSTRTEIVFQAVMNAMVSMRSQTSHFHIARVVEVQTVKSMFCSRKGGPKMSMSRVTSTTVHVQWRVRQRAERK